MHTSLHRSHRLFLDKLESTTAGMPPSNDDRTTTTSDYVISRAAHFDSNMLIVLAALLCALMCVLGLNSIVRCALRCSNRFSLGTTEQGAATTGLKKIGLSQIPVVAYMSGLNVQETDCAICLGEFSEGENVRVMPKCKHGFHVKCIDRWLFSHSSCPLCRQSLVLDQPSTTCSNGEVVIQGRIQLPVNGSAV